MTTCLTRFEIFEVLDGSAPPDARSHVTACDACQARLRELETAVAVATPIIAHGPLLSVGPARPGRGRVVLRIAAAIALAVGLARWLDRAPSVSTPGAPAVPWMAELSSALVGDATVNDELPPNSDTAYLQAALDGRWPCEDRGRLTDVRCF